MKTFIATHPVLWSAIVGAGGGIAVAAKADREAFKTWQSFHDAAVYRWDLATWRWFQGAVLGATTALSTTLAGYGIGAMS